MLSETNQDPESSPTSIFDLIFVKNPNKIPANAPIYIADAKVLTFGELEYLIRKCAYNLKEKYNIQKGDVVAIRSFSHIDYPVLVYAIVFVGATVAFIKNTIDDKIDGITKDLKVVRPKLFIIDFEGWEVSLESAAKAGISTSHILMFGDSNLEEGKVECVQNVLLSGENTLSSPYKFTDDELENYPIYLCYTSGSTGNAKAVMITTNDAFKTVKNTYPNGRTHSKLLAFKSFHTNSSIMFPLLFSILKGHQVYISRASTVDEICQGIQEHKISFILGSPYNIASMVLQSEHINKNYDLSSVNVVRLGGSAISKDLIKKATELFGASIHNPYGATEMVSPFQTTPEISAMGSIGKLKAGFDIRIVDEDENDTKLGEPGELLVNKSFVTKGYYNNPKETAKMFTKDGYYRTGDTVRQDENGLFWFVSRCSNLIKCYPTSYYPYETEKVIQTHPKVFECAVIGIFQKELSCEYARAYVTLVDEYDDEETKMIVNDILEYANKQLSESKQIRCGVIVKKSFERTPTEKIKYSVLKQEAEREQDEDHYE
ncbi:acetyl-CoA synthetase-like protein [Backusella circina FSU 941]|nr:acetyl-CoA synthetase-like protein [Backusella circina FSU 941]